MSAESRKKKCLSPVIDSRITIISNKKPTKFNSFLNSIRQTIKMIKIVNEVIH